MSGEVDRSKGGDGGRPRRILFVDDEAAVLTLLQAICRRIGPDWDVAFADGGRKALEMMEEGPFDVVVSDMRMPDMNGVELLMEVMQKYPSTARIILSGYADQQLVLRSLGATHQYLSKPCDVSLLKSTIHRIFALDRFLRSDRLKVVLGKIQRLPTLPALYFQLMRELASPNASAESVADLIRKDVSLTAKILQLVNSAFFGVAHTVEDVRDAVQILGFSTVRTLSLSIYVFSRFDPATMPGFPMDRLWNHSMATGLLARRIAAREWGNLGIVEAAFTGGILHDIGKLVLAYSLPELFQRAVDLARERRIGLWRAENEVIGGNHAEVGAYLLGLWGLPATIVESVAWHHHPQMREPLEFSPLTAVHMANFVQARKVPVFGDGLMEEIDQDYMRSLKLGSTISMWEQEP